VPECRCTFSSWPWKNRRASHRQPSPRRQLLRAPATRSFSMVVPSRGPWRGCIGRCWTSRLRSLFASTPFCRSFERSGCLRSDPKATSASLLNGTILRCKTWRVASHSNHYHLPKYLRLLTALLTNSVEYARLECCCCCDLTESSVFGIRYSPDDSNIRRPGMPESITF